ncbi:MAG: PaaI family thioesterase [Dehalococcoidia bacterium]|nr:PaaI family thioesterase [Dehalococcoidia bacterium]
MGENPGDDIRAIYSGRYWGHMGIETVEVGESCATSRVRLQDFHFNYNEVVHGGVISGLIDSAAGLAVRSVRTLAEIGERPHATSDLHVIYLAPARGSELVARAHVVKAGRTALFTEVQVFDDCARLVARGSVTFVIAQGRPATA